ncbi:MAG: hypothetical protein GY772_30605, partial [bacterium]|nr:hypothetical protein [bacterium]
MHRGEDLERGRVLRSTELAIALLISAPPPDEGEDTVAEDAGHADPFALPEPSEPWCVFLAKGIAAVGRSLEQHLLGTKLLSYYSEWCSTPRPFVSGIAYLDIAFLYDDPPGTPMRRTNEYTERKNLYIGIPPNLLQGRDPVLDAAFERVRQFYAQTFWSNQVAY